MKMQSLLLWAIKSKLCIRFYGRMQSLFFYKANVVKYFLILLMLR